MYESVRVFFGGWGGEVQNFKKQIKTQIGICERHLHLDWETSPWSVGLKPALEQALSPKLLS